MLSDKEWAEDGRYFQDMEDGGMTKAMEEHDKEKLEWATDGNEEVSVNITDYEKKWWDSLSRIEKLQLKLRMFYNTKIRVKRLLMWRIESLEKMVEYLEERDRERN